MKSNKPHVVPQARQVAAHLENLRRSRPLFAQGKLMGAATCRNSHALALRKAFQAATTSCSGFFTAGTGRA